MPHLPGDTATPESSSRRRSERRSYLFLREAAPFEEAGLTNPLPVLGRHRLAEAPGPLLRRPLGPEPRGPVEGRPRRRTADAAPPKLLADAQRALAASDPGLDVVPGEPFLAEEPFRFERREHPLDLVPIAAARAELERELPPGMLAAREQLERPRPELRLAPVAQAPTASPASVLPAGSPRPGRSISRNAPSTACATSSFCLRNSRTLSRPCPMRSPP